MLGRQLSEESTYRTSKRTGVWIPSTQMKLNQSFSTTKETIGELTL